MMSMWLGLQQRLVSSKNSRYCSRDPFQLKCVLGNKACRFLVQERARKLRIFSDAEHPFEEHPQLVPWEMAPRRRRVKEPLFQLPEGFEPLNSTAYRKRFEHMLQPDIMAQLTEQSDAVIPAEPEQKA